MANPGVGRDAVLVELDSALQILTRWKARFEEGVPSVDIPGSEDAFLRMLQLFYGELLLVSDKTKSLAVRYSGAEE